MKLLEIKRPRLGDPERQSFRRIWRDTGLALPEIHRRLVTKLPKGFRVKRRKNYLEVAHPASDPSLESFETIRVLLFFGGTGREDDVALSVELFNANKYSGTRELVKVLYGTRSEAWSDHLAYDATGQFRPVVLTPTERREVLDREPLHRLTMDEVVERVAKVVKEYLS